MEQRGELPDEAWGDNGGPDPVPRTSWFSAQRVRATGGASPARNCGPSEPGRQRAPLLPVQRSRGHNLGDSGLPGGSRWRIETSRLRRVTWGWTNTRPAAGQGGNHIARPAGWSVPVSLSRIGGKKMPRITRPQVPGGAGDGPGSSSGDQLLLWLEDTQLPTNGLAVPTRDAAPPAWQCRHLKPVL